MGSFIASLTRKQRLSFEIFTNDYWMYLNSLFDDNEKEKKNLITIFPDDLFFFDETDSSGFYN